MKIWLSILSFFFTINCFGQSYDYVYRNSTDSSFNCYVTLKPDGQEIRGMVIRDYSNLPDLSKSSPYQFNKLLLEQGLMILYVTTSNQFPEFHHNDSTLTLLDEIVHEVIVEHQVPSQNIFIGGISASGTRALRYTQFCASGKSKYNIQIRGVFGVDPPLDLARFYKSVHTNSSSFKAGMLSEAVLMKKTFPLYFNGSPTEIPEVYINSSVYCHLDSNGGNINQLKNANIILFHEPDLDWWQSERGAKLYDINSFDILAVEQKLIELGNENVQVVTTTQKGFDRQGNRKCHSWTIVDEQLLVNWIVNLLQ